MTLRAPNPGASTGLDSRLAAVLAYSAWWLTGLAFLALERRDQDVRFHAAQSAAVFGAASLVIGCAYATALPLMLVSAPAARVLVTVANVTWLLAVLLWAWLIYEAAHARRWAVPGWGGVVARLAGRR